MNGIKFCIKPDVIMTIESFRTIALSFPDTTEQPHFERTSFRSKKKIFATLDLKKNHATLKLSEADQDIFSLVDKTAIYPVPNKWGQNGWTIFELDKMTEELMQDALEKAYQEVSKK